ncbi:MAG TPA: type II secretion system protein N [Burkholderiales bacterium]|nr:type II secretion system protein N [Burkholderiales bacterium]
MTRRAARRRWIVPACLSLAGYGVCLLVLAPASVFAWGVGRATDGMILLEGVDGGLWRGRAARIAFAAPGTRPQALGNLTWDIAVLRLFRGQLAVQLTLGGEGAKGAGMLVVKPHALVLSQSSLAFPAAALATAFPALSFVSPGGEIALRAQDLAMAGDAVSGQAELDWIDASSALSPVKPLGTYRVRLAGKEGPAQFAVTTISGALEISGSGAWSRKTGLSFTGLARATASGAPKLQNLLQLLGPDDGSGARRLHFSQPP